MISVRVEIDPIKAEDTYDFIDRVHSIFARNILEEGQKATPVESGELRDSWTTHREGLHTSYVYIDDSKEGADWDLPGVGKVDWLLRGTGIWGPLGRPYCSKRIKPVTDWQKPIQLKPMVWRARNGQLMIKTCVRGINPRAIHGSHGVYDFAKDMETAIIYGAEKAVEEMNK